MNVIVQADHIIPKEMAKIQNQVESRTVKTEMITNETTYSITSRISTTQEGSNRLRLPALERGISAQQGHPAEGVVGKYRTLEQRRVGREMVGFQLCKSHLVLGFFDPSLRGGPLAVGTVGLPAAEWFGGDVIEVLVLRQWEEFALRMIRRRCLAAAYGDQEPAVLPIVGQAL